MTQSEKPGTNPAELVATLGLPHSYIDGLKVTGGQFVNFRKGWAVAIMRQSSVSHWFQRDGFDDSEALCGVTEHVRWLYGAGNYPYCSNCQRVMNRRIKSGLPV
jgi:hypothetical protein